MINAALIATNTQLHRQDAKSRGGVDSHRTTEAERSGLVGCEWLRPLLRGHRVVWQLGKSREYGVG